MKKEQHQAQYEKLGASATKAGLHDALKRAGVSESSGLFAQVTPDIAGDDSYSSFVHCDGAGTKSIIAYLVYRETGDLNAFAGLAQDALVMNLDDVLCLGTPERLVLANAVARNARLINNDALEVLIKSYKTLASDLRAMGVPLDLTGGETADCGDVVRTLLVDAVITGRIKKSALINNNRIVPGDIIVGLSSTGKASYEKTTNSGVASNGLTLARHSLLKKSYAENFPEVVDPDLEKAIIYRGPFSVSDRPEGLGMTVGEALLSPTRTYAPLLMDLYQSLPSEIHGVIHVTGGGLTKVLRFGQGNRYVKNHLFPTPPLFQLIQKHGEVPAREMYQVFNMGQRIEVYLPEKYLDQLIKIAQSFSIDAQVIGRVEKNGDQSKNSVVVSTPANEPQEDFEYEL